MPNIAKVLKDEITRLARKEVRAAQEKLKGATAQHHREIANLKNQLATLKRQVIALERQVRKPEVAPKVSAATRATRFVPKGLASTRKRLGRSAADLSKMMGVSAQTIYNWERGVTRPGPEQQGKLTSLRGVGKRQLQALRSAA